MKYQQLNRLLRLRNLIGFQTVRCFLCLFSIMAFISPNLAQQTVAIGLMDGQDIRSVFFSPTAGKYVLTNANSDTIYRFRSDDAVSISRSGTSIVVKGIFGLSDTLRALHLLGNGVNPSFRLRLENDEKEHSYFGDLNLQCSNGKLQMVNTVAVESYVARVVMAEVGYGAAEEYYRLQSIICRTYAVRNMKRHSNKGFDLCDHEHCQVYSGRKTATNEIVKGVTATSGLGIISAENELILSAFHANCGGQTANCEDVWREPRSYLKTVTDTFCLASRSAKWNKTMNAKDFIVQLGFTITVEEAEGFSFIQLQRLPFFKLGKDSIETGKMRRILRLRSAFFDLKITNGLAIFSGGGYGHGVGLCQQGAMKMAEHGYNYSQILGYYYKGVSLVSLKAIRDTQTK